MTQKEQDFVSNWEKPSNLVDLNTLWFKVYFWSGNLHSF